MKLHTFLAAGALVAAPGLATAQSVGSPMPDEVDLDDFAQTAAESWDDLFGRTVLIEFFAHW